MWHKIKKQLLLGNTKFKQIITGLHHLSWFSKTTLGLCIAIIMNLALLPGNAYADGDGLSSTIETCSSVYNELLNSSGSCDSTAECDAHRECIAGGTDGRESCRCQGAASAADCTNIVDCPSGGCMPAPVACADQDDFDCDDANDGAEYPSADPTTSSIPNPDHDSDLFVRNCDDDDDNDGVLDGPDDCEEGDLGWVSNAGTDHDSDGCRDAGAEDGDDDNDGIADGVDSCATGDLGWTSNAGTDHDGDGCRDAGAEDNDDDNDTVVDGSDSCPTGAIGPHGGNDVDTDGCRDTTEDTCVDPDSDNYGNATGFAITGCSASTTDADNCPTTANPDQKNFDGDSLGNICDSNIDGDATNNAADTCPGSADNNACYVGANAGLCFPSYTGVPSNLNPPSIDGNVNTRPATGVTTEQTDTGWKGAQLYTFNNGTDLSDVAFQAIKDSTHIYMSFEVFDDPTFDDDDLIILNFRPDGISYTINDTTPTYTTTANNDIRIFIYPNCDTGADGNGSGCTVVAGASMDGFTEVKQDRNYRSIQLWKNSANNWGNGANTISAPAGMEIKVRSHIDSGDKFWSVELKLPVAVAGTWPAFADDFLMYFNVVTGDKSDPSPTNWTVVEYMWPGFLPLLEHAVEGNANTYPYQNFEWARVHKGGSALCQGVSIDRSDIGTKTNTDDASLENTVDGRIIYDQNYATTGNTKLNRFYADVTNTGPSANVTAHFRIADWGYNGGWVNATWNTIPGSTANPTVAQTVPAAGAEFTLDWTVVVADIPKYLDPPTSSNSAHQCLLVELDSSSSVNFIKKSDYRNMNFSAVASIFEQEAVLSAKGYGAPPKGMDKHEFLLKVDSRKLTPKKPIRHDEKRLASVSVSSPTHGGKGETDDCNKKSLLRWTSTGYHNSGRKVGINKNSYKLITPTGGFGYYITHKGCEEVENWNPGFSGKGWKKLERLANGTYRAMLEENEVIKVKTRVKPVEKCSNIIECLLKFFRDYPWVIILILLVLFLIWYIRKKS